MKANHSSYFVITYRISKLHKERKEERKEERNKTRKDRKKGKENTNA